MRRRRFATLVGSVLLGGCSRRPLARSPTDDRSETPTSTDRVAVADLAIANAREDPVAGHLLVSPPDTPTPTTEDLLAATPRAGTPFGPSGTEDRPTTRPASTPQHTRTPTTRPTSTPQRTRTPTTRPTSTPQHTRTPTTRPTSTPARPTGTPTNHAATEHTPTTPLMEGASGTPALFASFEIAPGGRREYVDVRTLSDPAAVLVVLDDGVAGRYRWSGDASFDRGLVVTVHPDEIQFAATVA